MKTLLSTKVLSSSQKAMLNNLEIVSEEYNAIGIEFQEIEIALDMDNYIFTSQNAVRSFLRKRDYLPLPEKRVAVRDKKSFCVGQKTKMLLEENGQKVAFMASNSSKLAHFIAKNHKTETFQFICGHRRRKDLPAILSKEGVHFKEIIAYKTHSKPKKFKHPFNAILFFSPSGVQSYMALNKMESSTAFCIGETTASEAAKYANDVIVADEPSIESVLEEVIKIYN